MLITSIIKISNIKEYIGYLTIQNFTLTLQEV